MHIYIERSQNNRHEIKAYRPTRINLVYRQSINFQLQYRSVSG